MFKAIIFSLLYLGSSNLYTSTDFDVAMKQVIFDESEQEEIVEIILKYEKEQSKFDKNLEKKTEELQDLMAKKKRSREALDDYLGDVISLYRNYYKVTIDYQLQVKSMFSDREWNELVKIYLRKQPTLIDERKDRELSLKGEFDLLKNAFGKHVIDSTRLAVTKEIIGEAEILFHEFDGVSDKYGFIESTALSSRISEQQELEVLYNNWLNERALFYNQLLTEIVDPLTDYVTSYEFEIAMDEVIYQMND